MKKILIIKHGSLGDIVFALSIMNTIRNHYKDYLIHIITEKKYEALLNKSNFFDKIINDDRKNFFISILNIIKLSNQKYNIIIDLQNSQRTSFYNLLFRLFSKSIICSSRPFAQLRYKIPLQGKETTKKGLFNQLKLLNILKLDIAKYEWLKVDLTNEINEPTVLFIPGVSKGNKHKQWHPNKFADVAKYCESKNYKVCVVGTKLDLISARPILTKCKNVINKIESSPPEIIYSLALISKLILSNDTGPGHIASLADNKMIWLIEDNNVSKANIDIGENNHKISSTLLNNISSESVIQYIEKNDLL